jgi:hypothetical protein
MADEKLTKLNPLAAVKGRGRPLGGAPPVEIPPLDAEPIQSRDGRPLTMQEQAQVLRDPTNPLSPYYDPSLAAQQQQAGKAQMANMDPHAVRAAREGIAPARPGVRVNQGPFGGTLPPEARQNPNFRPGIGSMYAANQPGLAQQNPGERRRTLSEETIEGLEALEKFNRDAAAEQKKAAEEADKKKVEVDPVKKMAEDLGIENPDAFFRELNDRRDELDTPELRKAIESRCTELDIGQLIEEGELRQEVPIVRQKFVPTYRTVTGEEDLAIKRRMFGIQGGEQYIYDMLGMSQLTAGLYSINNRPLPSHLNDKKAFDEDLFAAKFRIVRSYPLAMLASLSLNFTWFDQRTRKLFVDLEPLKNG